MKTNKQLISFACAAIICCSVINGIIVGKVRAFADNSIVGCNVQAESAYLCDYATQTVIYAKNEKMRRPIASMTKIMLLILAFEKEQQGEFCLDEQITVSENASKMGGSQVYLESGGVYSASDLIKSIIVSSANDSSVAIAERLFQSEENAVANMNEKAKELNLCDTLFSNCTGLTKPTQYSSAKDVAIMLSELIKYPSYFKYSSIYLDEIEHSAGRKTQMTNTNKLIKYYNGCDGGKTGFTNEAGFCLAATAQRGAMRLISVVIGEKDSKVRAKDTSALFDYGFNNFTLKCVLSVEGSDENTVAVRGGKDKYVCVVPEKNFYVFGKKNAKENIKTQCVLDKKIQAPLKKGDCIGKYYIYKDNVQIGECNAVCKQDVNKAGFIDYAREIASN